MALRPLGLTASEILARSASRGIGRPDDPWVTTNVFAFGQLYIATDDRHRLLGIGVNNPETILVAICGRDEYATWKASHNALQLARRSRARARARRERAA